MPRPQFSLKTLLWLTLVVAAFLGGMALQGRLDRPRSLEVWSGVDEEIEEMVDRDGIKWWRTVEPTGAPRPTH